jgi:hypothetical protein
MSVSCSIHHNLKLTERYLEAYQSGEFSLIAEIMSDSLIIIDADYSKAYSTFECWLYKILHKSEISKIKLTNERNFF